MPRRCRTRAAACRFLRRCSTAATAATYSQRLAQCMAVGKKKPGKRQQTLTVLYMPRLVSIPIRSTARHPYYGAPRRSKRHVVARSPMQGRSTRPGRLCALPLDEALLRRHHRSPICRPTGRARSLRSSCARRTSRPPAASSIPWWIRGPLALSRVQPHDAHRRLPPHRRMPRPGLQRSGLGHGARPQHRGRRLLIGAKASIHEWCGIRWGAATRAAACGAPAVAHSAVPLRLTQGVGDVVDPPAVGGEVRDLPLRVGHRGLLPRLVVQVADLIHAWTRRVTLTTRSW